MLRKNRNHLARLIRDPQDASRDLWVPERILAEAYAAGRISLMQVYSGEWDYCLPKGPKWEAKGEAK